MRVFWIVLAITSILLGEVSSSSAALYRWKNNKGQLLYSTNPPTMAVKDLEIKRGNQWYPYSSAPEASTPETPKNSKAVVNYNKQNAMIVIPVTINNKLEKPFAVDTGATYTIISQEIANALNLTPNPSIPPITLQTANGAVQAPMVNLDSVTVGGLSTPNVAVAVHSLDNSPFMAGLLGLNFLNRFKMTVDATRNQLTLEPLQSPAAYSANDCVAAREWIARGRGLNNNSEEEALYYRQAISLCPDLVEAYYYLGAVYYHQKAYQRAISVHLDLLRLRPDDPQAHYNLGVLYMFERNFSLAKSEFQTTVRLNPDHQQAKEYLEQLKNY
jgi:clan AA aspartic protease (TIGR02281 family)